jgi:hypothetical protein
MTPDFDVASVPGDPHKLLYLFLFILMIVKLTLNFFFEFLKGFITLGIV